MSKIALSPNASGTGTFTVAAPNTNTDYTLTLPETTGTLALTTQAITQTTGSAPYYGARAWVRFNGTGTVAIREDENVSSITDNGTGDYTVNFTSALSDGNYSMLMTTVDNTNACNFSEATMVSSSGRMLIRNLASNPQDPSICCVAIFR